MRPYLFALILITELAFASQASQSRLNNYTTVNPVSETRKIYSEKTANVEYLIAGINSKWNWISSIPTEDSIATAQGWYTVMGARRDELKQELVAIKIEQLQNYYQDIKDLFGVQEDMLKTKTDEMIANRILTSPDYPVMDEYIPSTTLNIGLLSEWIINKPQQYLDFTAYLENLVLNNF